MISTLDEVEMVFDMLIKSYGRESNQKTRIGIESI